MELTKIIRELITLDWDDFTDWQIIDMIHELCILIDTGTKLQKAVALICKQYDCVLDINK